MEPQYALGIVVIFGIVCYYFVRKYGSRFKK